MSMDGKFTLENDKQIMRHITGTNRVLFLTLLVAALILPSPVNKQVMADSGLRVNGLPAAGHEMADNDEEDYSISMIKFFNWI
jgi:hypothetical protein